MIPPFIGTAVALIPRYWKLALIAVLLASIGIMKLSLAGEQRYAAKLQQQLSETIAAFDRFKADVSARTALAKARDEANARRVERDQILINQETVSAYHKEIDALRARAALRVRPRAPANGVGDRSVASVPKIPNAASRVDGATNQDGLSQDDQLIASEIAIRLKHLHWLREQEQVERAPVMVP
jgi:hypothetical protein